MKGSRSDPGTGACGRTGLRAARFSVVTGGGGPSQRTNPRCCQRTFPRLLPCGVFCILLIPADSPALTAEVVARVGRGRVRLDLLRERGGRQRLAVEAPEGLGDPEPQLLLHGLLRLRRWKRLHVVLQARGVIVAFAGFPCVGDGVRVRFRQAGHILGSASVELRFPAGAREASLVFSGDVGRGDDDILRDPQPVEDVVRDVVHALTAPKPKIRYFGNWPTRLAFKGMKTLPDRLRDWIVRRAMEGQHGKREPGDHQQLVER